MELSLVINALGLLAYLTGLVLVAALVGAVLAGVLRMITQIDDNLLSFLGKLVFVGIFIYLASGYFSNELSDFAEASWGRAEYYH